MWGGDLIDLTTIIKLIYCWCLLISNILVKIKKYNFSKLKSSVSIRSGFLRDTAYHFLVFYVFGSRNVPFVLSASPFLPSTLTLPQEINLCFFSFVILPFILSHSSFCLLFLYIYIYMHPHTQNQVPLTPRAYTGLLE